MPWTKQVSDLFDQIERTNRIAFKRKTRMMHISNIVMISDALTIASPYPTNHRGDAVEEEQLKKIKLPIKSSQNAWESLLNTDVDVGSYSASALQALIQPSPDPAVVPVLWVCLRWGLPCSGDRWALLCYDPSLGALLGKKYASNVPGPCMIRRVNLDARWVITIRPEMAILKAPPIQHLDQLQLFLLCASGRIRRVFAEYIHYSKF